MGSNFSNFAPEPFTMKIRLEIVSLFVILLLACSPVSRAQYLHNFQQDDTLQRKLFLNESLLKKEKAVKGIGSNYAEDYKRIYKEQFTEIEKFWGSSRPVTEKVAYDYLQKLVAKLTEAEPSLKGLDIRVVFSRDWWPNAVSMGDGTLALNAGLVIYMQSEAELVFVLAHEIAHYYLKHTSEAIRKIVETVNSESFKAEIKRIKSQDYGRNQEFEKLIKQLTLNTRRHGRDKESQADAFAIDLMIKAGYALEAARNTLQLLDKVDDTLFINPQGAEVEKMFNLPEFAFKKRWTQKESMIFGEMVEDVDAKTKKEEDSLKTHPDCEVRIRQLEPIIAKATSAGRMNQVDSAYFQQLRRDFYYEIMEECYRGDLLGRNLYYAILLLNREPGNKTAIFSIARAWNDVYQSQMVHKLGLKVETEDKTYPAGYNNLLRMVGRIKLDEILALNTAFCKMYYEEMKDIPAFKAELKRLYEFKKQRELNK